jgi:hypothetical protein
MLNEKGMCRLGMGACDVGYSGGGGERESRVDGITSDE